MFSFKKVLNISFIVFLVAFSVMVCWRKFDNTPLISGKDNQLSLYEWWHIESFEGGGANRQNYLNNLCLQYEKSNPTKLFIVKTIEADQLADALTKSTPHLISFSEQVAKIVLPYLKSFDKEYTIQDNFLESAKYNGELMAIPFIASGYCYFTKNNQTENLNLYTANNNMHSASSLVSGEINNGKTLSSYECYTKFVNGDKIQLLGTARDLFRIKNLESIGRITTATYTPVSTFTDLIQYVGITINDSEINKFVDFVMNDENQIKLSKLSLFSTKYLKLYTEPTYAEMEKSLSNCFVPNVFN